MNLNLVKIKEIRASERRFYQKIIDIYKECSYDYDKNECYAFNGNFEAIVTYTSACTSEQHEYLD